MLKKIKKINWKSGAGSAITYMAMMWIIAFGVFLFMEYFHGFSAVGKSQLYADILADGSVFIGNNGWGLDQKEANKAFNKLQTLNKDNFKYVKTVKNKYYATDKNGNKVKASKINDKNTMMAKVSVSAPSITSYSGTVNATNTSSTHVTYSGGMKIVMEAWKHTWEHKRKYGGIQTAYVWGGGHSATGAGWETFADCSGFVSGVYRKCGYNVNPGSCTWDMEAYGTLVTTSYNEIASKARPGDIILYWYSTSGVSQHVSIYAGMHNGVPWCIEMHGSSSMTYSNAGRGSEKGCHLNPLRVPTKLMVRRLVDCTATTDRKAVEGKKKRIRGLTPNETTVMYMLAEAGFNATACGAIMGNWSYEGQNNPTTREGHPDAYGTDPYNSDYAKKIKRGEISLASFVYEGKGTTGHSGGEGYGIAQWTTTNWSNPYADRKAQLWKWCKKGGSDVTDLSAQVSFAMHEIHSRKGLFDKMNSFSDTSSATEYFMANFEGIIDKSLSTRQERAAGYAQKYPGP